MTTSLTFLDEQNWAVESPINVVEGESITFNCTYWAAVTGTPTCVVYKNGRSVTATVFPSGSISVNGTVVTLKPATGMLGGSRYVFAVTATVGSNTRVKKFMAIVQRDEENQ